MSRLGAALLALVASSCARNAVFELELELPSAPEGQGVYAVVEARGGVEAPWVGEGEGVALAEGCARSSEPPACANRTLDPRCSRVISVVGGEADLTRPLELRVRFCRDPECRGEERAPEHRVDVERAFYLGRYTQARVCLDALPTAEAPSAERIARCEVRCRDGVAAQHCRLDGTHFCEPPRDPR